MLSIYLDESGHETRDFVVLAGFLGTNEQWTAFDEAWIKCLGRSPSFHIKNLRWGKNSTRSRLEQLGKIPHDCGLRPLVGAVRVSDYADLTTNTPEIYAIQGYFIALFPILSAIHLRVPPDEHIQWVFEEQHDYQEQVKRIFRVFSQGRGTERFSEISFVPKGATCRTQAADFLAYAVLQELRNPNSQRTKWCMPIRGDGSFEGMIVIRALIREIVTFSLDSAALLTMMQTGTNPRVTAHKYANKRAVHEALRRAEIIRAGQPKNPI